MRFASKTEILDGWVNKVRVAQKDLIQSTFGIKQYEVHRQSVSDLASNE